ncbi:MAG: ATP-binding protein [Candidatus Helarchaeales archaeon]
MIISINPVDHTIDINTDDYYPIHSFMKLRCKNDGHDFLIIVQVQQTHILEEYVQLRKQVVNVEMTQYLNQLLETGLKYVVVGLPILIIDETKEDSDPDKVKVKNVFIELERFMRSAVLKPHSLIIDEDQADIPDLLKHIFPEISGIYIGNLLYGKTKVYIPIKYLPYHMSIFGITGGGKSNLMQVMIQSVILHNIQQIFGDPTSRPELVSMMAIDPHDEYAFGTGEKKAGIQNIVESLSPDVVRQVMGDFYYLYPHRTRIQNRLRSFSREILISYEDILPLDVLNVGAFNALQAEFMFAARAQNQHDWINNILQGIDHPQGHSDATIAAVQRRLRVIERSRIFQPNANSSLIDIIDALDTGKILDVNASLLSDFEQFLFNTVVARTIFDIRKALKSSTDLDEFKAQLDLRLPRPTYERFTQSDQRLSRYLINDRETKDPADLPVIIFTIEEAPSLLNPERMKGQNVFKDISRQGRKFNLGLCVISQQVTTLDNAIMSNLNTMIHLPIGSEFERNAAIKNATSGITNNDLKSLEGTLGISIISGIWLTYFQKITIPLYHDYFKAHEKYFEQVSTNSVGGSSIEI